MQLDIIEDEVGIEIRIAYFKLLLLCHKCKATAHFQKIFGDMRYQLLFKVSFCLFICLPHQIKDIRVFHQIVSKVALRFGQSCREVTHFLCRDPSSEKIGLNLYLQNIATPSISNCLRNVPISLAQWKLTIKQNYMARPIGANYGRMLEDFLYLTDIAGIDC